MKFPHPIPTDHTDYRRFCIYCFQETITMSPDKPPYTFTCGSCARTSERNVAFDGKAIAFLDDNGTLWHESVAVFVFDAHGRILCFERSQYPVGELTIPAGHAEQGQTYAESAAHELQEEVGISDITLTHLSTEKLHEEPCIAGADDHIWHVYKTIVPYNTPVTLNDEGTNPTWLLPREILVKNPVRGLTHFVTKLFITQ